ncbi:biotin/lipoyl-binding protein [Pseudomonas sp. N040]|uniref:biotin/lipoyl-binding protein n=1 Tax=Pseudomonas sp. N040 TaxID=2785325 RepID=UPI001E64DE4C|nr:biotin/lipoyl-binding protein [Pseudomonas sp. N040]
MHPAPRLIQRQDCPQLQEQGHPAQPSEVAVAKTIHVQDGQQVRAGELLVELDARITTDDVERLRRAGCQR